MRVHVFQHVFFEGLGSIESWCRATGVETHTTRLFRNDPLPPRAEVRHLVVLGGPMGTGDEDRYPWLAAEKRFLRDVIQGGAAVLGICLGAQLIAEALEARVYPNPQAEIGWFPVHKAQPARDDDAAAFLPTTATVFHWHGDTFELPKGTHRLASSEACRNQGFYRGRGLVGLQFHLETTPSGMEALITNCGDELVDGPYIQTAEAMRAVTERFGPNQEIMQALLAQWAAF